MLTFILLHRDEFDVIAVVEPRHNRSPFILQEHKLGVEAWAGKILLKYTANRLIGWRQRLPEEKFIGNVCSIVHRLELELKRVYIRIISLKILHLHCLII